MKKIYVLDTNVILFDPQSFLKFDDNEVVIPITVIEEIDAFKKDASEIGRNARQFSRMLDDLRNGEGQLTHGVKIKQGGIVRVELGTKKDKLLEQTFSKIQADQRILEIALSVKEKAKPTPVIFLTKDTNLRIRADAFGLDARDYEPNSVDIDELYLGWKKITLSDEQISELVTKREIQVDGVEHRPNELLQINSKDSQAVVLGRALGQGKTIKALSEFKRPVWGIFPRNLEQTFAMDLLMDDSIQLVTLVGKAGTGKTLLALAAGLYKVVEEQVYHRVLVSRPVFPLGRDIGFLPGDLEEKLTPWMQPIFDNIEFLMSLSNSREKRRTRGNYHYKELVELGLIAIEPLTYIRGRSIPSQIMIVDEAQNLTPHEIKTIVTRAGDNTKVILTGDPYQIDNPYVDSSSNGLTYVVERMKNESISGHMTLVKGERSKLAELSSNLL